MSSTSGLLPSPIGEGENKILKNSFENVNCCKICSGVFKYSESLNSSISDGDVGILFPELVKGEEAPIDRVRLGDGGGMVWLLPKGVDEPPLPAEVVDLLDIKGDGDRVCLISVDDDSDPVLDP